MLPGRLKRWVPRQMESFLLALCLFALHHIQDTKGELALHCPEKLTPNGLVEVTCDMTEHAQIFKSSNSCRLSLLEKRQGEETAYSVCHITVGRSHSGTCVPSDPEIRSQECSCQINKTHDSLRLKIDPKRQNIESVTCQAHCNSSDTGKPQVHLSKLCEIKIRNTSNNGTNDEHYNNDAENFEFLTIVIVSLIGASVLVTIIIMIVMRMNKDSDIENGAFGSIIKDHYDRHDRHAWHEYQTAKGQLKLEQHRKILGEMALGSPWGEARKYSKNDEMGGQNMSLKNSKPLVDNDVRGRNKAYLDDKGASWKRMMFKQASTLSKTLSQDRADPESKSSSNMRRGRSRVRSRLWRSVEALPSAVALPQASPARPAVNVSPRMITPPSTCVDKDSSLLTGKTDVQSFIVTKDATK